MPGGSVGDFREGLAPVSRHSSGITEFIDHNGEVQFAVDGHAEEFHDGLALLRIPSGTSEEALYGFIDKTGEVVIEPGFRAASHFSDGLAAVSTDEQSWGYIGQTGEYVIAPQFNEAHPFFQGRAMVHEGGEFMLVLDAPCYWEGGTWLLIDTEGTKVGRVRYSRK